jgi:uncharacterized protein YjiS (DUF1127 family)
MSIYFEKYGANPSQETLKIQPGWYQPFRHWLNIKCLKRGIAHERKQLLKMPEAMLKDIGITRVQAETEAQSTDIPRCRLLSLK